MYYCFIKAYTVSVVSMAVKTIIFVNQRATMQLNGLTPVGLPNPE